MDCRWSSAFKTRMALADSDERFATVVDSGLFHVFADGDRRKYVCGSGQQVLNSGGRLFLMCFSDAEPGTVGPRRVSRRSCYDAFC